MSRRDTLIVRFIGLILLYTVVTTKKEEFSMKRQYKHSHLILYKPQQPPYPNAADSQYFAQKALDILTAIVSGVGFISAMVFLFTLA